MASRDEMVERLLGRLRHFLTVEYCARCNNPQCAWRQAALQLIADLDALDGKQRPVRKSQAGCASAPLAKQRKPAPAAPPEEP